MVQPYPGAADGPRPSIVVSDQDGRVALNRFTGAPRRCSLAIGFTTLGLVASSHIQATEVNPTDCLDTQTVRR